MAAFNLILSDQLDGEATDVALARAEIQLGEADVNRGRLVPDADPDREALDRQVWMFAGRQELEGPRTSDEVARAARSLTIGPPRRLDLDEHRVRLLSLPVMDRGRRIGTIVAGVSLAPYERTREIALAGSLLLAAFLLALVGALTYWVLSAALQPVARMTAAAADWSELDLDHRFNLGPARDELTQLAATLDTMLDRLAASLRREQRLSDEISHELRTPLAKVYAESQLALRAPDATDAVREPFERIRRAAEEMTRTLEVIMVAARARATPGGPAADAYRSALVATERTCDLATSRGISVEVIRPVHRVRVSAHAELVERMLHPLIENACRHAASRVAITLGGGSSAVELRVEDDGLGVDPTERESIFEPGVCGRGNDRRPGTGLGLALARRLAGAAGGRVTAEDGPGGRFKLTLPSA